MRSNLILISVVLGGLFYGAAFFVFIYPLNSKGLSHAIVPNQQSDQSRAFLLPVSDLNPAPFRKPDVQDPDIDSRAAALFDVKSGSLIFGKNENKRLPVASITKLMTALIILDKMDLNQIFEASVEDLNVDGNGADLFKGERIKGMELLKMMLVKSSNDAAFVFARKAREANIDLVAEMNKKAKALGMTNTNFADPAGLDDNDAFSTANDLIRLVDAASRIDMLGSILRQKSVDVESADGALKHHLTSTDQLLDQIPDIIIGKTGNTDLALGTMVLEVAVNNKKDKLISVILGSKDRFGQTKKLIDWSEKSFNWQ